MTDHLLNTDIPDGMARKYRSARETDIRRAALLITLALHALAIWWGMNSARFASPSPEKIQAIRVFLQPMALPELASAPRPAGPPAIVKPAPAPPSQALVVAAPTPPPSAPATPPVTPPPVLAATPEGVASPEVALSLAPLPVAGAASGTASRPAVSASGLITPVDSAHSYPAPFSGTGPTGAGTSAGTPAPMLGTGPAGSGLELYKRRLFDHIDGHKVYPPSARRRRLEGQVRVVFTIEPGGGLGNLQVSEGHPQLEAAARQTVQGALPLPLPADGVELPFTFSFRMDFRLR